MMRQCAPQKNIQIKKKHHYIWGHYLNQWSVNNGVYYITKSNKIACDSAKGLSWEHGFYKIQPLRDEDIHFIIQWSKKSPEFLQKTHRAFLNNFIEISKRLHLIDALNINSEEIEGVSSALRYNSLEDLHSDIESKVLPTLNELWDGNPKILSNSENMDTFCSFIGQQLARTKHFKELALKTLEHESMQIQKYPNYKSLFERNWWFISFMFGINIGSSLYRSRNSDKHIFIFNNTELPFVTSDNPAINIHPSLANLADGEDPKIMDLFFPLSPKLGYMINKSNEYDHLEFSIHENDVIKLNKMITKKSDKTLYSNSEIILKELRNYRST
jgi:hypothetical protein